MENSIGKIVYYSMYLVGFAIMMVISIKNCQKHNIVKKRAIAMTVFTYFAGVSGALLMGKIFTLVANATGSTNGSTVAIFGAVIFTPLFLLFAFLLTEKVLVAVKQSCWRDNIDLLTPGIFVILTCAKFGCIFGECCHGILCESFGIYNSRLEAKVFPIQIFETITMLGVLFLSQYLLTKKDIFPRGSAYPLTASIYSTTRFCWEFLRYYENEKLRHLFLGLTFWQLCCIIVIVTSVLVLIYLRKSTVLKERDYINSLGKKAKKIYLKEKKD